MMAPLVLAILLIAAAAAGAYYANRPHEGVMMEKEEGAMMEKEDSGAMMEKKEGTMMEKRPEATPEPSPTAGTEQSTGQLVAEFSMAGYTNAVKTGKVAVLYYYANWCPICRAEFPKFQAAVRTLADVRVSAFRVNYNDTDTDTDETTAAKTFQVGSQHTLVIVKNGELAFKGSTAGWTETQYTEKIREFLP